MKRKGIILKRTPKIKIAFAIIGIAFGLLLTSVFVFDKINQDKKVISPINAQNCGSGTFTWHNCTACYQVGGYCGGSLTYTCGSICLNPSCGAKACSCDGVCNCTCPSGYQNANNSCSTSSCDGTERCGESCSKTCYRLRYAITLTANGGTGTNCKSYTTSDGPCGSTANTAPDCTKTGYSVSYTQSGCGGTWNSSTGVCSSVTADMTITANWTENTVRVSYTENPADGNASATGLTPTYRDVTPGSSAIGPSFTTASGYVFVNFTITSGSCAGTFTASTGTCSVVNADMTIQANWNIRVSYTENIDAAGSLSPTYRDVGYGASATGPTVTTNTGYVFVNFTITSGSCAGTFTASTGTCSNVQVPITIVAVWYNSPPTFTVSPRETVASYSTSPTAIGASLTFRARATDLNASYYLIICSSNSVTAGASGAAPTCGATTYCTSSATASGSYATCSYTTSSGDAWSNAWYAFVCDSNVDQATCSSASQGSGNSGSPFFVNHRPSFTASSVSAAVNPGGTITWSTTSSDPDGNSVKLLVCKTFAMSAGSCTGGSWCTSSLVSSNASCSYVATAPYADGSYDAYPYIVDQFNLGATGMYQGVVKAFTVNNVAPSVSSVTLNNGAAISLTESTTTSVEIVADVTDDNGCTNLSAGYEISSVKAYLYRSGVAYTGCDTSGEANANYCYPEISCDVTIKCSAGLTSYSCKTSVQYYADPTTANTLFPTENWLSTAKATDDDSDVGTGVSTGVELNTLVGGDTTPTTLDFGSLAVGGSNDPLDKTLTHFPTGNVGIDITIKANTASMCTNYSTCTGGTPIPISHQKYSLSSSTAYSSGTILTTTAVESEINIGKQTTSTAPTKQTWWGIYIPSATLPGVYNGLNVIEYVIGETSGW